MTFEYLQRVVVEAELEVDNLGDCCIQAFNDIGEAYYLVIKTVLGYTEVLEYGPCLVDLDMLQNNYQIKYNKFEYNQGKLERIIDKFLNDGKRAISQAMICDLNDIVDKLINPIDKVFPDARGLFDE